MKSQSNFYKYVVSVALATAFILLIPLVAMQFTNEVNWNLFDFAVAWILLSGTGLTYKLVAEKSDNFAYRAAVGVAVATALFLVWLNLAVGIIGSEDNPANLMYIGVLTVGFTSAFITHFKPQGMAWILYGMALAQMLVAVIALIAGMHLSPGSSVLEILGVNGFFAALWIGSALLFRYSARKQPLSSR